MTDDSIDAMLGGYFTPLPVPPGTSRRLAAGALRGARELKRLARDLAIDATPRGVARIRPGRPGAGGPAAARRIAGRAQVELAEFFAGQRAFFTVPVDLAGLPAFQGKVLRAAARIPFGESRSYAWLAERIGHPRAARAVGNALGSNPVPFIVPCHRIVRDDGSPGGYGLGPWMKRALLLLEQSTPIYVGCSGTRIVCRAGCGALRRARPDRRVAFASVADARSVGYRPCRRCAPERTAGGGAGRNIQ
jgi:methylated-DNA-[protein]-cysteine S-methyltransferase